MLPFLQGNILNELQKQYGNMCKKSLLMVNCLLTQCFKAFLEQYHLLPPSLTCNIEISQEEGFSERLQKILLHSF